MKLIVIIGIVALAIAGSDAESRSRAKRFAGLGAISTVGGRVGCVVSENGPGNFSLYINSHFTKFLSSSEQSELANYKTELAQYKENIKSYIEERRKAVVAQQQRSFGGIRAGGPGSPGATGAPSQELAPIAGSAKQPEAPKKPSFCSEKDVTQYVFDGCSVQGDSVYIGDNFVRKLTPVEQERLVEFDEQFTAYQDSVRQVRLQQMEQIFGKTFGALFESVVGGQSGQPSQSKSAEDTTASGAVRHKTAKAGRSWTTADGVQLDAPKTPDFCTLII